MKLTEKQKRFADYYIEIGNATEAYKKAGYKVKTDGAARANASRLLANANVKSYINERLKEIESKRIADAKEVLEYLTKVMRGEEIEEVVVATENGIEVVRKKPNVKDSVKAAELIGKRYAMWTEKQQVDGVTTIQIIDDIEEDNNEKN